VIGFYGGHGASRRTLRDATESPPGARSPSFGSVFDLLLRRREAGAGPGELRPGPATSATLPHRIKC